MFFGTVRQKIFDGKTWYPLVCINFIDTPNFLKHWRDAYESFRHCETLKFWLKIVICPLLSINFFDTRKIPENTRVPLQNFSLRFCETKIFDKTVMPPCYAWKFSKKIFWNTKFVLQWKSSLQWDKSFDGKLWYPPPLSINNFSPPEIFSETHNGSLAKFFRSCEMKKFERKVVIPPLLHRI